MKKLLLLFLLFFTTDSFASGIDSNSNTAPCTNNTLETYSGNTNLQADWAPNTINLRWYNGNTLLDVQTSANTCVYDSTLTIPSTAPSRIGYTFDGWTVRPEMDFRTIPTDFSGSDRWAIGCVFNQNRCLYGTTASNTSEHSCSSDMAYKELQKYEWKIKFDHGYVYGMSGCSTIGGTSGYTGNPVFTNDTGQYCWCKATGYKAINSDVIKTTKYTLPWVFAYEYGSHNSCASLCALACDNYTAAGSDFRTALFTPVQ